MTTSRPEIHVWCEFGQSKSSILDGRAGNIHTKLSKNNFFGFKGP